MLEVERRERRLEHRGEHVAVPREPVDLLARDRGAALEQPLAEPELRAMTAQLARETTWERIFAIRPSSKSGKRSYSARAIASSSTLSPRNSSRSYEDGRSAAQLVWVKTAASRSAEAPSISRSSESSLALTGATRRSRLPARPS